ncbi:MAG TPA: prepilin-type N-terminal cleavage/methylation domain-containing protein [Patescibacteria group bacterium]|nr:prepilin-type N-terminal cleavage/methylation domain-containing protein [Patescibacteria group bacterium]
MMNKKGFTMVELLVVLIIVGILASVATPLYLTNAKRAKASEAVGALSLIRQAEREYYVKHNVYGAVTKGNMKNDSEAASNAGMGVDVGVSQYFSNDAYTAVAATSSTKPWNTTNAVDFVLIADGTNTVTCGTGAVSNCAVNGADVKVTDKEYIVQMDNSGTAYVSYDGGSTYTKW